MAIAPIQGMLSRSILYNISIGLGSGLVGGYAFWYGHHVKNAKIRDAYYIKLAEQREAEGM